MKKIILVLLVSMTLGGSTVYAENVINAPPSEITSTSPEVFNPLGGMSEDLQEASQKVGTSGASKSLANSSMFIIKFVLGTLPFLIIVQTVVEILAIAFSPMAKLLGTATSSASSGGLGGSSSSSEGLQSWLSDDYKNVCKGEGSGDNLTWVKIKTYSTNRIKLILISFIVLTVISVPPLFDLAVLLSQLVVNSISKLVDWLRGVVM